MAKKKAAKKTPAKAATRGSQTKRGTKKAAPRSASKKAPAKRSASSRTKSTKPTSTASPAKLSDSSNESRPNDELPKLPSKPPAWLSHKPVACAKWRELISELETRGLLVTIDLGLFGLFCEAWQAFSDAEAEVGKTGSFFETDKGYVAIHPAELVKDKAIKRIVSLGDRLGVGVFARKNLGLKPKEEDGDDANTDPLVKYSKLKG